MSDVAPDCTNRVYLLDVRHGVELRQLTSWLAREHGGDTSAGGLKTIALPISDERRVAGSQQLSATLTDGPETLLIPARVSWRIPGFEKSRGIRLRHLLLGDPRAPGRLRAWMILLRNEQRAECITGKPASIAELRQRFERSAIAPGNDREATFAQFVMRQAGLALDVAERDLRGSRYKAPKYVAQALRADPRFHDALMALAKRLGKPVEDLEREAEGYMSELIARPRALFIDLKAKLERFMLSLGYDEEPVVDPQEVERLRLLIREKPTLILFTHKTYLDGLAATDIAYRHDMPLIHTFGGINMAMPGLSTMMRGSGGIFIRRSFRDNHLYKLVLRHYISYLLEKRFPMTWAFEGTRSRLGKLMPPRFGLLKYVIDSAHSNGIADLHFVPVSTSFDLIRDVEDYVSEQRGDLKKPETLSWFLGYLRSLREPRGRIYVNFGDPVVVATAPDPEDKLALSKIAFEVAVRANRVTPFTLNSLICLALLGCAPRGLTVRELRAVIRYLLDWGEARGIRICRGLEDTDLESQEPVMQALQNSGLFIRYDLGSETVFAVEPARHAMASYYRNTIIHHFLNRAIIELSLLKARELPGMPSRELFWQETERLRDLFKFEFYYPEKEVFRAELEAELGRTDPDWEARLDAGDAGLRGLTSHFQPLMGHAVFLPLAEAYTIVFDILDGLDPGASLDQNTCIDMALREGRQAYLLRRITSEASIAKLLFENGYRLAEHLKLAGETTAETKTARKALLREFRALSRRMERSRLECLRFVDRFFEQDEHDDTEQ